MGAHTDTERLDWLEAKPMGEMVMVMMQLGEMAETSLSLRGRIDKLMDGESPHVIKPKEV